MPNTNLDMTAKEAQIIAVMQQSIDSLVRGHIIETALRVTASTPLLGGTCELESMQFVTFISDLEERLTKTVGKDVYIILDRIDDFDINEPFLSAATLARHLSKLLS